MLCYVDDVLAVSHDCDAIMTRISDEFELKGGKWGPPEIYLGGAVEKFTLGDGRQAWSMHSKQYVKNAVQTVKDLLAEEGRDLCSRKSKKAHKNIFPTNYKPELDTSPECDEEHASQYRQLIGILRWAIELSRIDVLLKTSIISPYTKPHHAKGISRHSISI